MRLIPVVALGALATACASQHIQAHTGFGFHGELGLGMSTSEATSVSQRMSGDSGLYALSGGYAIVPNLVVGAELWGSSAPEPEMRVSGQKVSDTSNMSYDVVGVGPRLAYTFMPVNLYVAVTPSMTRLTLRDASTDQTFGTEWGPGLRAAVGKDWFVGDRWGLGVAGVLQLCKNRDQDGGPTWRTAGGGVVFSATFN